jgi:S-(hydroxymethyl)glutathione dehydrogenase / alcohol dehydrogenase
LLIDAAVLERFGEPLVVQQVELAEPGPGEALVRLVACGICHTDLVTASGADPSGYAPVVLGHEGAGVVEAVGPDVHLVQPGDSVLTMFQPQCDACENCLSGRTNICLTGREGWETGLFADGTTRLSRGGEPLRHFLGTSAFAQYTVMPEIALARIDPAAPLQLACLFACGYTTGIGAATTTAEVRAGSTCVVFGAGLVGLGAVAGCRLRGAERILCVDLSEERLALARAQGATEMLLGGPDAVERIRERTGGNGADYSFEATGKVDVMRQAVEAARIGWGTCVVTGVAGRGELLELVPRLLITGRRVMGCELGGIRSRTGVAELVDQWLQGQLDVEALVSNRLHLTEIDRGFEAMRRQEGIRSVVVFD